MCFTVRRWSDIFEVFICSEAGKPIYYLNKQRDDEFVVTLMGVCQALINFFIDAQKDLLKTITTISGLRITFAVKTPLIIVIVTKSLCPLDPQLIISQVYSKIVSILTIKTLKSVFEQRPTFDLRRLLGNSEKLIDTLIEDGLLGNPLTCKSHLAITDNDPNCNFIAYGYLTSQYSHRNQPGNQQLLNTPASQLVPSSKHKAHGGRALIRVMPLNPSIRDSITNTINSSINAVPCSVLFSLLFHVRVRKVTSFRTAVNDDEPDAGHLTNLSVDDEKLFSPSQLITILNYSLKKTKLHPLDAQILEALVVSSEGQLMSSESLWLPVCLPRVDSSAFIHAHISYLNQSASSTPNSPKTLEYSEKLCLVLLTADREDFSKCQQIKDALSERLNKVHLNPVSFGDLNISQVQTFAYHSVKPYCINYRIWPRLELTNFNELIAYVGNRMLESNLKMFYLLSDKHKVALLGWRTPTFSLFVQFDATVTHTDVITAASNITKWIRREEDKIKLKEYQ